MRKIIFCGAFDPIHDGHIKIAQEASKHYDADVIFVPAKISVWKKESVPTNNKLEMINLSIKSFSRFYVDDYELKNDKDVNYSVDTLRYLKNKYSKDELLFLIGSDQVIQFHLWKNPHEISELAKIIYCHRAGVDETNPVFEKNIKEFNMEELKDATINVSSTEIKNLQKLDISDDVIQYIEDQKLYYIGKLIDHIGNGHRFEHSLSVAHLSYEIAKKHKLENAKDVYIAALIHDIGKNSPNEKEIMENHFKEYINEDEAIHHQFVGAYIAKNEFGITNESILNAIMFHTTGYDEMDQLAKIVYSADKIEPTRQYDSSDLINSMLKDIDEGFKIVLEANKEFFEKKNIKIKESGLTAKCFKKYL